MATPNPPDPYQADTTSPPASKLPPAGLGVEASAHLRDRGGDPEMDCCGASVVARRPADQPNTHRGQEIPPLRAGAATVHPNRTNEDSPGYEHRWWMSRLPGQPVGWCFQFAPISGVPPREKHQPLADAARRRGSHLHRPNGEKGCGSTILPQQRCPAAVFVVVDLTACVALGDEVLGLGRSCCPASAPQRYEIPRDKHYGGDYQRPDHHRRDRRHDPPQTPTASIAHHLHHTIAFPFASLDPCIRRRPSSASGNLLCAFDHAGGLLEAAPSLRAAVRFSCLVQPPPPCLILSIITPIANGHAEAAA
jgi:hypothetical protein